MSDTPTSGLQSPFPIPQPQKLLTIGGSDSGGAAGVQADLKTWAVLGMYGMSVLTVITAQNSLRVEEIHPLPAGFVAAQLDAVLTDYGAAAVKTGFIGRSDLIVTIAARLRAYRPAYVVIDPVLVNHRAEPMFPPAVAQAYIDHLLPLATLVTPNRTEAALLSERPVETLAQMETAARWLHRLGPRYVLISGGRKGDEMVDVLFDGRRVTLLRAPRVDTVNTHGSGDVFSAAVAAFLAQREVMETAVHQAHHFTAHAILRGAGWRLGQGHGPVIPSAAPDVSE